MEMTQTEVIDVTAGFENGREPQAKESGQSLEARKGKQANFLPKPACRRTTTLPPS
jgi:hypothetical protein